MRLSYFLRPLSPVARHASWSWQIAFQIRVSTATRGNNTPGGTATSFFLLCRVTVGLVRARLVHEETHVDSMSARGC